MKALALTLACTVAALADSIPAPAKPGYGTLDCTDSRNNLRWECARARKQGEAKVIVKGEEPQFTWDTVTTITIQGEDTTRTITIKRVESWEGTKKDVKRFVDMYVLLGVLNLIGVGLLFIATVAQ